MRCYWLLTVGLGASGGVLKSLEGGACLARLSEVGSAFRTKLVEAETVNKEDQVSGGADTHVFIPQHIPQRMQRCVLLESLPEMLGATWAHGVSVQPVSD
jgi:hypothetical protein